MENCKCWHHGTCWGTKECEECTCDGDTTKCNFYPEYRNKKLMTKSEAEARFNIKIVGD